MPKHGSFDKIYQKMKKTYAGKKDKNGDPVFPAVYYAWVNKHGYDDTKDIKHQEEAFWNGTYDDIESLDYDGILEWYLSEVALQIHEDYQIILGEFVSRLGEVDGTHIYKEWRDVSKLNETQPHPDKLDYDNVIKGIKESEMNTENVKNIEVKEEFKLSDHVQLFKFKAFAIYPTISANNRKYTRELLQKYIGGWKDKPVILDHDAEHGSEKVVALIQNSYYGSDRLPEWALDKPDREGGWMTGVGMMDKTMYAKVAGIPGKMPPLLNKVSIGAGGTAAPNMNRLSPNGEPGQDIMTMLPAEMSFTPFPGVSDAQIHVDPIEFQETVKALQNIKESFEANRPVNPVSVLKVNEYAIMFDRRISKVGGSLVESDLAGGRSASLRNIITNNNEGTPNNDSSFRTNSKGGDEKKMSIDINPSHVAIAPQPDPNAKPVEALNATPTDSNSNPAAPKPEATYPSAAGLNAPGGAPSGTSSPPNGTPAPAPKQPVIASTVAGTQAPTIRQGDNAPNSNDSQTLGIAVNPATSASDPTLTEAKKPEEEEEEEEEESSTHLSRYVERLVDEFIYDSELFYEADKKKWMQKAVKKPGSLRAAAKRAGVVKGDEPIPTSWLQAKAKSGGLIGRRARLALTFKKFRGGRKEMSVAAIMADSKLVEALTPLILNRAFIEKEEEEEEEESSPDASTDQPDKTASDPTVNTDGGASPSQPAATGGTAAGPEPPDGPLKTPVDPTTGVTNPNPGMSGKKDPGDDKDPDDLTLGKLTTGDSKGILAGAVPEKPDTMGLKPKTEITSATTGLAMPQLAGKKPTTQGLVPVKLMKNPNPIKEEPKKDEKYTSTTASKTVSVEEPEEGELTSRDGSSTSTSSTTVKRNTVDGKTTTVVTSNSTHNDTPAPASADESAPKSTVANEQAGDGQVLTAEGKQASNITEPPAQFTPKSISELSEHYFKETEGMSALLRLSETQRRNIATDRAYSEVRSGKWPSVKQNQ